MKRFLCYIEGERVRIVNKVSQAQGCTDKLPATGEPQPICQEEGLGCASLPVFRGNGPRPSVPLSCCSHFLYQSLAAGICHTINQSNCVVLL